MIAAAKSTIDLRVYTMEAVLKTAYRFTKLCFVEIGNVANDSVDVTIRPKRSEDSADTLLGEFTNDLVDQRLRTMIADETRGTRDLIMAHALSQTGFVRPDLETADYRADPLEIRLSDKARSSR